ncbi:MAG: ABC transporter substrate-binding protein [Thermoanaerobaculia bacterium]
MKRDGARSAFRALWLGSLALVSACSPRARTTLTVVQGSDILTLDPNSRFEVVNDTVAMNLFDSLLRFDQHMTLQPSLAVRWENPNDRTWRIHLRPGVKFHDGSPLTSDDVVFTFRRILQNPDSEIFPFLTGIRGVTGPDPLTVEIQTELPTPLLTRLSFIYILPRKAMEREGETAFLLHPIGTGPYRFVGRHVGEDVEIEAFPDYWGGPPAVPRVKFRSVASAEERWRVATSAHPMILLEGPRQGWEEHKDDRRLRLIARPSLSVSYMGVNVTPRRDNPLADLRVRQAIRLALDLREVLRRGAANHGFVATQFVPPDVIGFNPSLEAPGRDLEAARRLLAESGHPAGMDLNLDERADSQTPMTGEIVRELREAGIRLTVRRWGKAEFLDRIDKGLFDLHVTGWICSSGDSAELFESSLHTRQSRGSLGRDNGTGYSNPSLDALIEQILTTIDSGARIDLEKRAMATAVADLPLIPLLIQEDRYVLSPDVVWEPRADGEIWVPDVSLP